MHINGSAVLLYNSNNIVSSTFTRDFKKTSNRDDDYIHLEIDNSYMPVGMNYFHETSNPNVTRLLQVNILILVEGIFHMKKLHLDNNAASRKSTNYSYLSRISFFIRFNLIQRAICFEYRLFCTFAGFQTYRDLQAGKCNFV